MPLFFIHSNQIKAGQLHLTGPIVQHIALALRHQVGDKILFVDEHKTGYVVQLLEVFPDKVRGIVLEEKKQVRGTPLNLTLGQAILKAKKMDWILQKATELGVSRIVPVVTERIVAALRTERIETKHTRWETILKEAAQQSGRWDIPKLDSPTDFACIVQQGPNFDLALVLWEGETRKGLKQVMGSNPKAQNILVLIGPEGGFSEKEIQSAARYQIIPVSLGWRILRAETACLSVLTLLQYELGDLHP